MNTDRLLPRLPKWAEILVVCGSIMLTATSVAAVIGALFRRYNVHLP